MDTKGYFKDKICIVTAANSGIGYALSEELLKRGLEGHPSARQIIHTARYRNNPYPFFQS